MDLGKCVTGLVNVVAKGTADELDSYDLSPVDFSLLRLCLERGECTATELADELPVDASRISRMVTRMVDKDLLIRRRLRDDRRVVMLRLSPLGNELVRRLLERIQGFYGQLTDNIGDEDMGVFTSVTLKILANYDAMSPKA